MIKSILFKEFTKIRSEDGFSTLTVVLSLLITLSLIFSSAQVYRISSASADIQNVADAASQAAESEVAEFMILVRISDSIILSLSLGSLASSALGVVCLCIPPTAELGTSLLEISHKIMDARDSFANKASSGLNSIQKSLPFLSTAKAYNVAKANNGGTLNAKYVAISILFPGEGVEITPGNINNVRNLVQDIDNTQNDIKSAAKDADDACRRANEAKEHAFMADCGNNPNYCMYERARTKAYMEGADNPLYKSVDTWSFSVALKRARAYYPQRLKYEKPEGSGVNAQSNSALRKVFYNYASQQMQTGYVHESDEEFDAYFPHLPKNTDEMRSTSLYTDIIYPVSTTDNKKIMHSHTECPGCCNIVGYGSIANLESEPYEKCPYCQFSASSLGKVAAASSNIDNGFEYHYSIIENCAKEYQEQMDKARPACNKVKNYANNFFNKIKELIKDISNKRIYAAPPGSLGCITMVVNTSSAPASTGFESSFVSDGSNLGVRAAISGSTIIEEYSDEGKNIVNFFMDGIASKLPGVAGAGGIVLDCWSSLLKAYSNGQSGIIDGIERGLNQIPLMSSSGLGTWAAKTLSGLLSDIGLETANLNSLKPVLINSVNIATKEKNVETNSAMGNLSKNYALKYLSIRNTALSINDATNSIFATMADAQELAGILNLSESNENGKIEIATIKPIGDWGPSIPITITLPKFATSAASNIISNITSSIQTALGHIWGGKVWR